MSNTVKYLESCTDEEFFTKAADMLSHIRLMYRSYDPMSISISAAERKRDIRLAGIHYSKYRSIALRRQNGNRRLIRYSTLINTLDREFVDFVIRFSEND